MYEYCMSRLCQECQYKHLCHVEFEKPMGEPFKFKKIKNKTEQAIEKEKSWKNRGVSMKN